LDSALSQQLIDALRWAGESGARAVIRNSGLRHFSAGANLDAMLEAAGHGDGTVDWPTLELLRAFDELPIPIVAAGGPTVAHAAKSYYLRGSDLLDEMKTSD
jgi:enoyl-CoA hydratase/carnithine racemase